jgi:hypothetical protein
MREKQRMNFNDRFAESRTQATEHITKAAEALRKDIVDAAEIWRAVGGTGAPNVQDTVSRLEQAKDSWLQSLDKAFTAAITNIQSELLRLSNR